MLPENIADKHDVSIFNLSEARLCHYNLGITSYHEDGGGFAGKEACEWLMMRLDLITGFRALLCRTSWINPNPPDSFLTSKNLRL